MIRITKNGEKKYKVSLDSPTGTFDRNNTYLLKKEISDILKPGGEVLIDIGGLRVIKPGAITMLSSLVNKAKTKKCSLQFTNIDPAVKSLISNLMGSTPIS